MWFNNLHRFLEGDRAGSRTRGDQLEQDQREHRGNANCQDACDAPRRFIEGRALHWTIETNSFVIDVPTTIRINALEAVPSLWSTLERVLFFSHIYSIHTNFFFGTMVVANSFGKSKPLIKYQE
jgi:hypothetical protein